MIKLHLTKNAKNLKLLPSRYLKVELEQHYVEVQEQLRNETDLTEQLVSAWTDKEFRGMVNEHGFKLISSEAGRGAFCVFVGDFQGSVGTIEIRIHKVFRILFGIILTMPCVGFAFILLHQGVESVLETAPALLIGLLVFRFVFIGPAFVFISSTGLKKLTRTLNIKALKR